MPSASRLRSRLPLVLAACLCLRAAAAPDLDAAFAKFWNAKNPSDAAKAANDITKTGASFDDVYTRLRQGRTYSARVATGVVRANRLTSTADYLYTLDVPVTYDPARTYQVRIQLHGGVMRPDPSTRARGAIGRLAGAEQIYVMPVGWNEAPWWSDRADRQPARDSRYGQAHLQRRREPRGRRRRLRRRDRRLLRGDARHDAVCGVSPAERIAARADSGAAGHRRRAVPGEPAEQAVLHRERWPRSAVPRPRWSNPSSSTSRQAASASPTGRSRQPGTTRRGGPR